MMTPYRLPLWRRLAARLPLGIGVICLVETEANRTWAAWEDVDFPTAVLSGISFRVGYERHIHARTGVARQLRRWRPRVVWIGGWDTLGYWSARRAARRMGSLVVIGVGTHAESAGAGRLRLTLSSRFVRRSDAVFAYGASAAAYARTLGVPAERVFAIGNPVDVAEVSRVANAYAGSPDGQLRLAGLPRPVFAYAGQLVERKSVVPLMDAFEQAMTGGSLVLAGDGPLRAKVVERTARNESMTYLGSLSPRETWELLGIVDCLVLPSREEVWGLVVNEALAAGAYCVVSETCGAAELIKPPRNGVVIKPDLDGIVSGLMSAAEHVTASGFDRAEVAATASAGDVGRTVDAVEAAMARLHELGPLEPRRML
jgi:glycosyltransferase involved in cell wall biosynthesis